MCNLLFSRISCHAPKRNNPPKKRTKSASKYLTNDGATKNKTPKRSKKTPGANKSEDLILYAILNRVPYNNNCPGYPFNYILINVSFLFQVVALALTALILPGLKINSLFSLVGLVGLIYLTNAYLWDAALFYSVPDSLSLRALLTLVCNGLLFFVLVRVLPGVECRGIFTAIITPVLFTILTITLSHFGEDVNWNSVGASILATIDTLRGYLLGDSLNVP